MTNVELIEQKIEVLQRLKETGPAAPWVIVFSSRIEYHLTGRRTEEEALEIAKPLGGTWERRASGTTGWIESQRDGFELCIFYTVPKPQALNFGEAQ